MKVTQTKTFSPVTITLETPEELEAIGSLLNHTAVAEYIEKVTGGSGYYKPFKELTDIHSKNSLISSTFLKWAKKQ